MHFLSKTKCVLWHNTYFVVKLGQKVGLWLSPQIMKAVWFYYLASLRFYQKKLDYYFLLNFKLYRTYVCIWNPVIIYFFIIWFSITRTVTFKIIDTVVFYSDRYLSQLIHLIIWLGKAFLYFLVKCCIVTSLSFISTLCRDTSFATTSKDLVKMLQSPHI